jgi:AcrR family transcriptional regulator
MTTAGRRPGPSRTREAILEAAREGFATRGYERTTIRGVARRAGVDPALVHHFFGTKEELFVAAVEPPVRPGEILPELIAADPDRLGEQIVRVFLSVWDAQANRDVILALLRSAVSNERAAAIFRGFITRELVPAIEAAAGKRGAAFRTTLLGTQLVGLAVIRYIIRAEPLASADPERLARVIGPTIQRYVVGEIG